MHYAALSAAQERSTRGLTRAKNQSRDGNQGTTAQLDAVHSIPAVSNLAGIGWHGSMMVSCAAKGNGVVSVIQITIMPGVCMEC
jgi:hypothetical protein